ncbi:urease subunit beta [Pseudarthrobacter sp. PS3-L1]|uniref:urease subunit beta n=1 Tax=Pseudarthrobacter sp. PS3-L1 TaxID=3046207 RepID=UPI0024BA17E0|nr:urease subunit beta [Pseudarthrobacter sp. PS3-L1]MDJ0320731.1 urease subunit beta [Pseudarthrobacter sp. PS3-L1]
MIPGEYVLRAEPVTLNDGRDAIVVAVVNTGDRPIQVGSHFHFAEANAALTFDRAAAHGRRLDIPAGTAARFEPGDSRSVRLIELAGAREVFGLSNAVNGPLDSREETP